ncbi:hypothetical protein, conserved [Leishmania tarentolae]|uniref:Uncharacterized protein n=1 Tax=Leishmania tarentolae TaxID=5689 RepID=A0A640KEN9_LEITA|nr:hypothetical protein, conserved [Leishmania tarentolae]
MLLQEVRYYQLPAMEKSVMDCFEFQQRVVRRQLPQRGARVVAAGFTAG